MNEVIQILIILLGTVLLLLTWPALIGLHQPTTLPLWMLKVFTTAVSPFLFLGGIIIVITGSIIDSLPAVLFGGLSAMLFLIHIIKTSRPPDKSTGFEQAFGSAWEDRIPVERRAFFLSRRYSILLPKCSKPVFKQNISFYTIPGSTRNLLCDIWEPPENIKHSGLAFIYLHGAAWVVSDKDFGTRTFFKWLTNQGHVIMDVAYRLFPECDLMGMVHDAKHAIAWLKTNAATYGVSPDKIIVGGGSSGGHIALLTAYTSQNNQFLPMDLDNSVDVSVQGVISLYGQSDLVATYYHTSQHLAIHSALAQKKKGDSGGMPKWIRKSMGADFHRLGFDKDAEPGMLKPIIGGDPVEKPETYALFSPVTHVSKTCPATLILHGKQDILAPVKAIRKLHMNLQAASVPVIMHLLPQTDHAFDLILPKISPPAHNGFYDVERFLGFMAVK
jgi:acetyl esterase/lipase